MTRLVRLLGALALLPGTVIADEPRADPREFVDVATVIPDAVIDVRYATKENFTGEVLYPVARCKLRRAVAARLARVAVALRAQDRRLLLWDCYRPSSIQAVLWKHLPDARYVANPKTGSRHSRGAAIDLGIVDQDGGEVVLPTAFDDASRRSHRDVALRGARGVEAKRLETAMHAAGFIGLATEWWHFDAPESGDFALSNEPL
ncbi:MAG: M15 family metallopeptidase [Proteobacteria bacterium]|nr:M15 family metallopeptidase [Pseudomonadota bacterium]